LPDPRARRETYIVLPTAFAAEFPNDNSDLHLGTIWMCEQLCGLAEAHLPAPAPLALAAPEDAVSEATAGPEAHEAEDVEEPIEIVESIELEGPIEIVPAPLESSVVAFVLDRERDDEPSVADVIAAEMLGDGVPEPDGRPAPLISSFPPPSRDPFEAFLQTLSDVACDAGQTFAASEIGAGLADDPVARAWRAILNGESDDFSLCGTPLDEWAAGVLARIVSAPNKAAPFRRALRSHGVAAFGLIEAAAA
jgi:hypothetical protein